MAAYTSARNGPWDANVVDGIDTWGAGLGVYPSGAGDTAVISAGHTVTYNVSSATAMGDITINGILKVKRDANTLLTLGNNNITVSATGELDWGKTGDLVNSANTAQIIFTTTGDNLKGITVASGGKFYTLDNPAYYGSIGESALQADWTVGSVINVNTNVSAAWKAGDTLLVHRGALYSAYATDCDLVTIAVGGVGAWDGSKCAITVNEAWARIKYAGGKVVNVSRNVILSKASAVTTIGNYNSSRPYCNIANTYANPNAEIGGIWTGWYQLYILFHTPITAVIRNGYCGVAYGSYHTISGNVYSNNNGVYGGVGIKITGKISYNAADVLAANTNDFVFNYEINTCIGIKCINAKTKNPPTFANRNSIYWGWVSFEHYLQSKNSHYKFHAMADIIRNATTVRTGGAPTSIEVVPQSTLSSTTNPGLGVEVLGEWVEDNVPATLQNRNIYVKGEGWTSWPTAGELWFEAEYHNNAVTLGTTITKSTAVLINNVDWTSFAISFTPAQSGKVTYRVYFCKYEAASKIYIDAALYRS
jgi:hypothetical protein